MIRYPSDEENKYHTKFYISSQKKRIDKINQAIGDMKLTNSEEETLIWLSGCEDEVVEDIISIIKKFNKK